jgi:anti-sigma regulatory factor (Ser/Thr protein kinase)
MGPTAPLELNLPPEAASIGRAREVVCAFSAELGAADPGSVGQAITEAVTAIVLHGARAGSGSSGSILIRSECVDDQLLVRVSYDTPESIPNSERSSFALGISTVGLALIEHFADSVELESGDRGAARLLMRFELTRSD